MSVESPERKGPQKAFWEDVLSEDSRDRTLELLLPLELVINVVSRKT